MRQVVLQKTHCRCSKTNAIGRAVHIEEPYGKGYILESVKRTMESSESADELVEMQKSRRRRKN